MRSSLDLPRGIELDGMLRYVDDLPDAEVDRYLDLMTHLIPASEKLRERSTLTRMEKPGEVRVSLCSFR